MINNTFFIVFRTPSPNDVIPNSNQDRWGWEYADGIEIFCYKEAQKMREEYQAIMPNFAVRIRAVRIEGN
jgi:hypothetical protein